MKWRKDGPHATGNGRARMHDPGLYVLIRTLRRETPTLGISPISPGAEGS